MYNTAALSNMRNASLLSCANVCNSHVRQRNVKRRENQNTFAPNKTHIALLCLTTTQKHWHKSSSIGRSAPQLTDIEKCIYNICIISICAPNESVIIVVGVVFATVAS